MHRHFSNSHTSVTRIISAAITLVVASGFAADWPGWLGQARDGHAAPGSVVPKSLPLDPKRVWAFPIGEGHATTHGRHVTTPIIDGNLVMVASKENSLMGVELTAEPGTAKWQAAIKWQTKDHFVNFSSPVAVGGYVYGLGPNRDLFCVETKTGKPMWSQEGFAVKSAEYAHLAIIVLGENLLILTETGEVVLVAADSKEFKELGRAQVCRSNWCNPSYAHGKLFLRDDRELICVDLLP